jgi:hypothetical protein
LFRHSGLGDPAVMATLQEKIAAERSMRSLLADNGLPQPDEVEYGHTCIRLFWRETRHVVIVQIDEPPPDWVFAEDMGEEERRAMLADGDGELEPFQMPFERFDFKPN